LSSRTSSDDSRSCAETIRPDSFGKFDLIYPNQGGARLGFGAFVGFEIKSGKRYKMVDFLEKNT
jgi:hypothetical protein